MDDNQVHVSGLVIPVVESDLSGLNIQALIGRDVLDQGILIYEGRHDSGDARVLIPSRCDFFV